VKITTYLTHSALTRSGTGRESFKVIRNKRVPGMVTLRFLPAPEVLGNSVQIEVHMDARTAINLGIITEDQDV
jgi:hypothetical protein